MNNEGNISIRIVGQFNGKAISPDNYDIRLARSVIDNIILLLGDHLKDKTQPNVYSIEELNANLNDILADVEKKAGISLDNKVRFTLRDKITKRVAKIRNSKKGEKKIPYVCKSLNVPCIDILGLCEREGWQF